MSCGKAWWSDRQDEWYRLCRDVAAGNSDTQQLLERWENCHCVASEMEALSTLNLISEAACEAEKARRAKAKRQGLIAAAVYALEKLTDEEVDQVISKLRSMR